MLTLVMTRPENPPAIGCAHQTPDDIEERWRLARRLRGRFYGCACCHGPTLSLCCPCCEQDFIRELFEDFVEMED